MRWIQIAHRARWLGTARTCVCAREEVSVCMCVYNIMWRQSNKASAGTLLNQALVHVHVEAHRAARPQSVPSAPNVFNVVRNYIFYNLMLIEAMCAQFLSIHFGGETAVCR